MRKLTTLLTGVLLSCHAQAFTSDNKPILRVHFPDSAASSTAVAAVHDGRQCHAFGTSLASARDAYQSDCTLRRIDCDPVAEGWLCASHRMVGGEASALWAQRNQRTQQGANQRGNVDCMAVADNLALARRSYRQQCKAPRQDCDRLSGGRWLCASQRMDNGTADTWLALMAADPAVAAGPQESFSTDEATTPKQGDIPEPERNDVVDDLVDEDTVISGHAVDNRGYMTVAARSDITDNTINDTADPISPWRPTQWSDSYAVDGQCYCDSTFDHGLDNQSIETPDGEKTVRQICADIGTTFGNGALNRTYYNTIQCGHPPANNAPDEASCPGIVGGSAADCQRKGPTWNLDALYPQRGITVSSGAWWQPKATDQLSWQLQLQGEINTSIEADVYFIDADAPPATINALKRQGKRVMCYISAGSIEDWRSDADRFPQSVIGNDYHGWPGERWLNVRDIDALAPVMRARLDQCEHKGFDGIDADNVNGHVNNTGFSLTRQDVIRFIRWLADESHARGMAFSLKNASDVVMDVIGNIDMIQMESCHHWRFCNDAAEVVSAYNKPVFMVEYEEITREFNAACNTASRLGYSAIYRNLQLTGDGIYRTCD